MARYVQLKEKEIQSLALQYGIEISSCEPINGGACNSSYLINNGTNSYVMTVFVDKSHQYVNRYCEILKHLEDNSFLTSKIMRLGEGGYVTEVEDKPVILKDYLEGEVVMNLERGMLLQIGEEMAKLHALPDVNFIPQEPPHSVHLFSEAIGLGIDPEFEKMVSERGVEISRAIYPDLPRSLIHGDLFFDNVLFQKSGLIAFIDFVESCNYYKVFDLGMAMVGQCVDDGELNFMKARALVEGYEKLGVLEDIERESLQLFVEYSALTIAFWRFFRHNVYKQVPEKSTDHRGMAGLAKMFRSIPESDFMKYIFD